MKNKHASQLAKSYWKTLTKEQRTERNKPATDGYLTYFSKLSPKEQKEKMEKMRNARKSVKKLLT